jgi:TatD DNase family protein
VTLSRIGGGAAEKRVAINGITPRQAARGAAQAAGIIARAMWIDTHCHLDAPEFDADRDAVAAAARAAGVRQLVMPAVRAADFDGLAALAARTGFAYALGIHPLCVAQAQESDLERLRQALAARRGDPRLVAVGEIGLDHFAPGLDRARQQRFYRVQLTLAREAGLPVVLHLRRAADDVLAGLRRVPVAGGIAHAFNGSAQQAAQFAERGFCLGFGGAMTFERARHIRHLAATLPAGALALETDAPDIPPQWLYRRASERGDGAAGGHGRNAPAELPRIARTLAALRGWGVDETAAITSANAGRALPGLARLRCLTGLMAGAGDG